ncbi:MAG TPA: hypothetical protein VKU00_12610, partial [Chthonomonadaceae bacterium]|nr:hypothetical protein [Chthonomonadaceae bacterium]
MATPADAGAIGVAEAEGETNSVESDSVGASMALSLTALPVEVVSVCAFPDARAACSDFGVSCACMEGTANPTTAQDSRASRARDIPESARSERPEDRAVSSVFSPACVRLPVEALGNPW